MNRGGAFSSAVRSTVLRTGLSGVFAALRVESAAGPGTRSASIIAGFGSPSGPVSTQREMSRVGVPPSGRQQDMAGATRSTIRVVFADGHPIHGHDLECLSFEL